MDPSPDPSQALLRRWQTDGDVDALDELLRIEVSALATRLRNRGRGMLRPSVSASDLVQEAVARMLDLDEAPVFEEPRQLRAYLWTAAWRLLLNRRQARGHSVLSLSRAENAGASLVAAQSTATEAEREDQNAALNVVMNLLRDEDRDVLELVYFQHVEIADVARRLGIQRAAADMRLTRARRRLAEKMISWTGVVE
jgi:RNA polymerase sigma factor (sigma-70 family)